MYSLLKVGEVVSFHVAVRIKLILFCLVESPGHSPAEANLIASSIKRLTRYIGALVARLRENMLQSADDKGKLAMSSSGSGTGETRVVSEVGLATRELFHSFYKRHIPPLFPFTSSLYEWFQGL